MTSSLECVPIPDSEEVLSAMCTSYAVYVAFEVARVTEIEAVQLQAGYCACPNTKEGFHALITVNGRHGFNHLHWETQQQATDFSSRAWKVVDKVLDSWNIHSFTGPISIN